MECKFNLLWDSDVTVDNDFRSQLLGRAIFDMHCSKCLTFIGAYHEPEDCKNEFCPKCGQKIKREIVEAANTERKKRVIKLGEIFEVDGKEYVIIAPTNATDEVNEHGQIVLLLSGIDL